MISKNIENDYLNIKGRIFDIQKFSVHDGPGIRTIIFLKGCFFRCRWCCNPESQNFEIEKMKVNGKIKSIGEDITVKEVLSEIEKDRAYYRRSGGGVTLSGGECLFQPDFAYGILKGCKELGINTAIETTACTNFSVIERILPEVDYVLMDIKHINPIKHKEYIGSDNSLVLENIDMEGVIVEIGEKIRRLRIEKQLTQEELANRCELSKGFISQVENDLTSPSIATLIDILEILGTNLREFFSDASEEKVTFTYEDMFETENEDLKYKLMWLIPNAQKNEMEPIMITLEPNGQYIEEEPHEGEEFGFVLSGTIILHLGKKKFKVKKGESFYFKPRSNHYISNSGKTQAKVIWISTPPSF